MKLCSPRLGQSGTTCAFAVSMSANTFGCEYGGDGLVDMYTARYRYLVLGFAPVIRSSSDIGSFSARDVRAINGERSRLRTSSKGHKFFFKIGE